MPRQDRAVPCQTDDEYCLSGVVFGMGVVFFENCKSLVFANIFDIVGKLYHNIP